MPSKLIMRDWVLLNFSGYVLWGSRLSYNLSNHILVILAEDNVYPVKTGPFYAPSWNSVQICSEQNLIWWENPPVTILAWVQSSFWQCATLFFDNATFAITVHYHTNLILVILSIQMTFLCCTLTKVCENRVSAGHEPNSCTVLSKLACSYTNQLMPCANHNNSVYALQ